jgi:hypothetical protein
LIGVSPGQRAPALFAVTSLTPFCCFLQPDPPA